MSKTKTTPPTADEAFTEMKNHGGHFARKLAAAWFAADPENKEKIEKAFAVYLNHYATYVR